VVTHIFVLESTRSRRTRIVQFGTELKAEGIASKYEILCQEDIRGQN
jgi:hypothetical protein